VKLEAILDPEEKLVFEGLDNHESMRELARKCGCSPATLEKTRLRLERKAARLDPVVRARAQQIRMLKSAALRDSMRKTRLGTQANGTTAFL
jgi:hypothetical protein